MHRASFNTEILIMKLTKALLVLFSALLLNSAYASDAEEFLIARGQVTNADTPTHITLKKCIDADDLKIVNKSNKVEIKKVKVRFKSGKEKDIIFFSTFEANEESRWRSLGWHSDDSCIEYIRVDGYAKHNNKAPIQLIGRRDS